MKSKVFDYACAAVGITDDALLSPAAAVGIWSHADVVPVGSGWTYPPFEGVYKNGLVIGRGAQDNKCSAIAGLYILECIREMKIPLQGHYLWYAGCSEECGMQDIDLYLEKYPAPKINLIADCGFPVCIGEKTIAARDKSNPAVKCLTDTYNRITGENSEPYSISGSTYASKLPNAYPYGIILGHKDGIKKYMPPGHGDYHQPDEAVEIDKLLEAMVIYIISIIALDKEIIKYE
ncbi:MAG: M20/M25/M40 family metallo-hydrolase [Candidatus Ornithomonoglobus sp.]